MDRAANACSTHHMLGWACVQGLWKLWMAMVHGNGSHDHPFEWGVRRLLQSIWQGHARAVVTQQEEWQGAALRVPGIPVPGRCSHRSGRNGRVLHVQAKADVQGGAASKGAPTAVGGLGAQVQGGSVAYVGAEEA